MSILVYNKRDNQAELITDWSNNVSTNANPERYSYLNMRFNEQGSDEAIKLAKLTLSCNQANLKISKGYKVNTLVLKGKNDETRKN